ncbi:MAG TPA: hypothetical protein VGM59_18180 [Dongiaceae bacterium]
MPEPTLDPAMMEKLASALSFICGAEHACTVALKAAAESGKAGDVKKARAAFMKLKPSERNAALAMLR